MVYTKGYHSDIDIRYPLYEFDPIAINNLNEIISKTSACIVVSSSWRSGETIESLQKMLNLVGVIGTVVGLTPHLQCSKPYENKDGYTIPRGCEIDWWLRNHTSIYSAYNITVARNHDLFHIENYVILDDDNDMLYKQKSHFIQTSDFHGLTQTLANDAILLLNSKIF